MMDATELRNDKQYGRLEKIETFKACASPSHNPPTMMHIPAGYRYRHTCPSCGNVTIIMGHCIAS